MYDCDPDTMHELTSEKKEDWTFLKEAKEVEYKGNIPEATRLYHKAYKLDPSLDLS